LKSALDTAKQERDQASADRHEQIQRQEKRNQRGVAAAARGGMPKILIGGRKRRAQVTTGKIDVATIERVNAGVREAYEAYQDLKIDPVMYADLIGQEIPSQKLVAEARDFNIRFHDWLYQEDLNFSWRGNLRLALKGENGSGKSTLIKALLGENFESRGELRRGGLSTLYLDQKCAVLDDTKNVFENIRDVCFLDESEIRNGLAKFLFTKDKVFQAVSSLSGGERLRAALARGLLSTTKPELLILDEPTNNLDLENVEFLENLVREFKGALLIISHDQIFLENCGVTEELILRKRS
jgi:ATPase subunit of ABC transporter with duplicated ATPase domains